MQRSIVLYLVRMDVNIPSTLPADQADEIKSKEKAYSQSLQREGRWPHLWRVVGQYSNYSVFDVGSNDELHAMLQGLPLYPFMDIQVIPLAKHPSSIS
jgi:muconolactone D-isomerase